MSRSQEEKVRKFLVDTSNFDAFLPQLKVTPMVLTDSKGSYLKSEVSTAIESSVIWWYNSGWNSDTGLGYLTRNVTAAIRTYGRIHVYVWLGTCDLTKKLRYLRSESSRAPVRGCIDLNPEHSGARLISNFEKISELARRHKFKLTFLELPVYSIREYNKNRGHDEPDIFSQNDKQLQTRIKVVNEHIERLNNLNQFDNKKIPRFNCDLSRNRKNRGRRSKKYYTFGLYRDGLHPDELLSKCWLRKITIKIKQDCY